MFTMMTKQTDLRKKFSPSNIRVSSFKSLNLHTEFHLKSFAIFNFISIFIRCQKLVLHYIFNFLFIHSKKPHSNCDILYEDDCKKISSPFSFDLNNFLNTKQNMSFLQNCFHVIADKSNVPEGHLRKRRFANEDDIISLDFEIKDRQELPLHIEQSILNILIVNKDEKSQNENSATVTRQTGDSESDDDEDSSSGGDVVSKKFTLKPQQASMKYHRTRHQHGNSHSRSKGRVQVTTNFSPSIKIHAYRQMSQGRHHILTKEIFLPINSDNENRQTVFDKWIQIDLTTAVKEWLNENENFLKIDLMCEFCSEHGLKIVNLQNHDASKNNPALNIIGTVIRTKRKIPNKKKKSEKLGEVKDYTVTPPKKTFCKQNGDEKCCRHKWVIDFKELGGYDYIIEPRKFDAGFCDGTCPYRFNVGNNHAFFQSLARHQSKNSNIPNVCCAPTRFMDLEFLHVDEDDNTKLKVTTMKKMKAMRCSCT